mgnify:CR=1 FL=1
MRIMAQMAMVMNLDKCIGCHTCSVTCKQAWTNRGGTEYVWFNNVETRPGQGYPRRYDDQETWQGGWVLNRNGRLRLRAGGRVRKLLTLFASPVQPTIEDYYEPWTYDYETLLSSPATKNFPVATPKSLLTGKDLNVRWSANWDDDLGGSLEHAVKDPMLKGIEDKVKFEFEQTFMFYLPRIFVNLAMETEPAVVQRLLLMARKLFRFMTMLAVPAVVFGLWLYLGYGIGRGPGQGWMHAKLALVLVLIGYHHGCGVLLHKFERGANARSHTFYRWFNELPVFLLLAIIWLVLAKPF